MRLGGRGQKAGVESLLYFTARWPIVVYFYISSFQFILWLFLYGLNALSPLIFATSSLSPLFKVGSEIFRKMTICSRILLAALWITKWENESCVSDDVNTGEYYVQNLYVVC